MRIRLLKPIGFRKVGSELTVGDGVGELWILQRKAERVIASTQMEAMVPPKPTHSSRARPKRGTQKANTERVALT